MTVITATIIHLKCGIAEIKRKLSTAIWEHVMRVTPIGDIIEREDIRFTLQIVSETNMQLKKIAENRRIGKITVIIKAYQALIDKYNSKRRWKAWDGNTQRKSEKWMAECRRRRYGVSSMKCLRYQSTPKACEDMAAGCSLKRRCLRRICRWEHKGQRAYAQAKNVRITCWGMRSVETDCPFVRWFCGAKSSDWCVFISAAVAMIIALFSERLLFVAIALIWSYRGRGKRDVKRRNSLKMVHIPKCDTISKKSEKIQKYNCLNKSE